MTGEGICESEMELFEHLACNARFLRLSSAFIHVGSRSTAVDGVLRLSTAVTREYPRVGACYGRSE